MSLALGGWLGPPLSPSPSPHLQCPSPTVGPLPLTCSPPLPGATPNLHLAAGSQQGFLTPCQAPRCLLPHLALLLRPQLRAPKALASDPLVSPTGPGTLLNYFICCAWLFEGDLLDISSLHKTKSQHLPQNETRIPHEPLVSQTLIFTLRHP